MLNFTGADMNCANTSTQRGLVGRDIRAGEIVFVLKRIVLQSSVLLKVDSGIE